MISMLIILSSQIIGPDCPVDNLCQEQAILRHHDSRVHRQLVENWRHGKHLIVHIRDGRIFSRQMVEAGAGRLAPGLAHT